MTENNDGLQESRLALAVRKAFKQLLKDIENEPALKIESASDNTNYAPNQTEDIQSWLFRRKETNYDNQPGSYKFREE